MKNRCGLVLLTAVLFFVTSGCRNTYYAAWEKLGKHKRDLLKDNVEEARDQQKDASEQFKDSLTRLKELYRFEGGDLEKTYNRLQSDYDRSVTKAEAVKSRIAEVEQVAGDLFAEWEKELQSIGNERLRSTSRMRLTETQDKYKTLREAMKRAEKSMEPVLAQFKDQVLYLKHNLNAQAVGALKGEALDIEKEVQQLLSDMNKSIAEADVFIKALP